MRINNHIQSKGTEKRVKIYGNIRYNNTSIIIIIIVVIIVAININSTIIIII